jgi:hypothetical protein
MDTEMNAVTRNTNHTGVSNFLPKVNIKKLASKSLAAARRGKASYTQGAFYKFYHLLAKVLPHTLVVKFSSM